MNGLYVVCVFLSFDLNASPRLILAAGLTGGGGCLGVLVDRAGQGQQASDSAGCIFD